MGGGRLLGPRSPRLVTVEHRAFFHRTRGEASTRPNGWRGVRDAYCRFHRACEFDVAPAFLTDTQAAQFLGLSSHQLYLLRAAKAPADRRSFCMARGSDIRSPPAQWAASLPQFVSRAEAYAANPVRAKGAARQRATTAKARQAKIEKRAEQSADT